MVTKFDELFFVYGTLKRGHGNHRILKTCEFLGPAVTVDRFVLTDVGFPYMYPENLVIGALAFPVLGEVYRVTAYGIRSQLDSLEGYPGHYDRRKIDVILDDGGGVVQANAYIPVSNTMRGQVCGTKNISLKRKVYAWP